MKFLVKFGAYNQKLSNSTSSQIILNSFCEGNFGLTASFLCAV